MVRKTGWPSTLRFHSSGPKLVLLPSMDWMMNNSREITIALCGARPLSVRLVAPLPKKRPRKRRPPTGVTVVDDVDHCGAAPASKSSEKTRAVGCGVNLSVEPSPRVKTTSPPAC